MTTARLPTPSLTGNAIKTSNPVAIQTIILPHTEEHKMTKRYIRLKGYHNLPKKGRKVLKTEYDETKLRSKLS